MHLGTCFLCGRKGMLEDHHVFSGPFRQKSERYGLKIGLCGDTCHRNGRYAVHSCRETADSVKQHWQIRFMEEHQLSVSDFIREYGRNYLNEDQYTDERSYTMNVTAISGRLTRDPELRRTQDGIAVCSFSVAVDRPNEKEKTDFLDCVAWRQRAEFVSKYFRKGTRIEVSGPITTNTYEKDGKKHRKWEIRADNVFFGEAKRDSGSPAATDYQSGQAVAADASDFAEIDGDDEELPF